MGREGDFFGVAEGLGGVVGEVGVAEYRRGRVKTNPASCCSMILLASWGVSIMPTAAVGILGLVF